MKTIGIDIGTTSICGISLDTDSGIIEQKIEKKNDTWIATENSWEKAQNPDKILEIAFSIIDELYSDDVVSIGVTGQMHGIVYLNSLGDAVSPLYTWQDERGNLPYNDTTYAKHLNSFAGYGYVTHFYNKQNGLVPENAVKFCTIHDYVAMKLAGKSNPITHISDAASFGQYDLSANAFTVCDSFLPDVSADYTIIGNYKKAAVTVAIGDNQASFIGSASGQNSVLVNVGTGSQVSLVSERIVNIPDIEVRPYIENKYLLVGCSLCGGKSFDLLERFFRATAELVTGTHIDNAYAAMDKAAATIEESSLKVDNRFMGTRSNTEIKGSITSITPENFNPYELIRAMISGMSKELYDMFANMNTACENLIGSGNGIRKNKALTKELSKDFGTGIKIPCHREEACFGAALFSLVAVGVYGSISEAQKLIKYEV
ncbi:MAG: hypothetical protein E7561_06785 [Ruminococcaceae bacterium]|nr:hypothetical protein [Oscillospiraceae bacterium]